MEFTGEFSNFWEMLNQLDWADMAYSSIPEIAVFVFCLVGLFVADQFGKVPGLVIKLQRLNFSLIAATAILLIARTFTQKIDYNSTAYWLTYFINLELFFIVIVDIFTILAGALSSVLVASDGSKKPMHVWIIFLVLAGSLSITVTVFTVRTFPRTHYNDDFDLNWESMIYGIFTLLVAIGSIGCFIFATYTEETLRSEWKFDNQCSLDVRFNFNLIRTLAKQSGYNSALKTVAIFSMMFYHQKQVIYHSVVLIYLTITTTLCFFCHVETRQRLMRLVRLDRTYFGRVYLGARSGSAYETNSEPEQRVNSLEQDWDAAYEKRQRELAALRLPPQKKLTWVETFRKAKKTFENINSLAERNRVNPSTHSTLFLVQGTPNPTLTII